nr:alcohol dehydrogenase catalytic domain-containing protein [Streptomyces sp. YIM 130001]
MRAARYHEYGGVGTLVIEEAPDPRPGSGEIRIRVTAAGVNPVDWKVRSGAAREVLPVELPAIPGRDAVGVVDEIGDDVSGVRIGDRVFGLGGVTGATAELAVLTAWAPAPAAWNDEQAAGAGLAAVTALAGLEVFGSLEGRTLLVEGAAGGVGSAAVEFAVAQGATADRHERDRAGRRVPDPAEHDSFPAGRRRRRRRIAVSAASAGVRRRGSACWSGRGCFCPGSSGPGRWRTRRCRQERDRPSPGSLARYRGLAV